MTEKEMAISVITDLFSRINANLNGVRTILNSNGVTCDGDVTVAHLITLRDLNSDAFDELVKFLYPEQPQYANAEWDAAAQSGIIGNALNVFGNMMGGVFGMLDPHGYKTAQAQANAEAQKYALEQSNKRMLIVVGLVVLLIIVGVVAMVIIGKKR